MLELIDMLLTAEALLLGALELLTGAAELEDCTVCAEDIEPADTTAEDEVLLDLRLVEEKLKLRLNELKLVFGTDIEVEGNDDLGTVIVVVRD